MKRQPGSEEAKEKRDMLSKKKKEDTATSIDNTAESMGVACQLS